MERKEKFTPDEVNFTDYMVEKIAATIRGGEIMGTVKDDSVSRDLERLACLIIAAPDMYEALQTLKSAMLDVLDCADLLDDVLTAADEALEKAEKALKKARGEE